MTRLFSLGVISLLLSAVMMTADAAEPSRSGWVNSIVNTGIQSPATVGSSSENFRVAGINEKGNFVIRYPILGSESKLNVLVKKLDKHNNL